MAVCQACDAQATHGWQRQATPAEVAKFAADPSNPAVQPHETSALVPVYACDEHVFRLPPVLPAKIGELNLDLLAATHGCDCAAPPDCTCEASRG